MPCLMNVSREIDLHVRVDATVDAWLKKTSQESLVGWLFLV